MKRTKIFLFLHILFLSSCQKDNVGVTDYVAPSEAPNPSAPPRIGEAMVIDPQYQLGTPHYHLVVQHVSGPKPVELKGYPRLKSQVARLAKITKATETFKPENQWNVEVYDHKGLAFIIDYMHINPTIIYSRWPEFRVDRLYFTGAPGITPTQQNSEMKIALTECPVEESNSFGEQFPLPKEASLPCKTVFITKYLNEIPGTRGIKNRM